MGRCCCAKFASGIRITPGTLTPPPPPTPATLIFFKIGMIQLIRFAALFLGVSSGVSFSLLSMTPFLPG